MSDQVPAWAKWILGIVASLMVTAVIASISLAISVSRDMAVIKYQVQEALGDDSFAETIASLRSQHSKHWQYDSQLRDSLNEARQAQDLPPMPSPTFRNDP